MGWWTPGRVVVVVLVPGPVLVLVLEALVVVLVLALAQGQAALLAPRQTPLGLLRQATSRPLSS